MIKLLKNARVYAPAPKDRGQTGKSQDAARKRRPGLPIFGGLDEKEALVTCKSYVTQRLLTKPAQDVTKV